MSSLLNPTSAFAQALQHLHLRRFSFAFSEYSLRRLISSIVSGAT
jgi:hypothetical protein